MLQVHTIKAAHGSKHRTKRVGRGNASGHGTSATRGGKGQTARSGGTRGLRLKAFKNLMQSTPKLRGFKSIHKKPSEIYLGDLESRFESGDTVDLQALQAKALVSINDKAVKIVSTGELKKKLTIVGLLTTKGAAEKIKQAGGEVK
ncbi:MAG: 50S ribosomal protein L15 [Candidatus Magasanikbacteria bacterium RIFCSPLOWO2_02_FULL_44_11]|uniref:Large ribosomal subunit protein uL15 n=2 Tax=Candidatus Magasanikiibacteriota TaxID=1752731 RepID=A0A1F6N9Y0_9BACT|nr:MAG: 50S ribosomal protein L15 [Candidatus Magasanikbacteria bacterium RIFCSPHIGHO2_02_FULL_45_10]OGH80533.1 MAG: 50S ribosomal protein L15 [Candidatus Magasanikbacteria bacterium RIFCSPLOWO2_02_FULL_44_11]